MTATLPTRVGIARWTEHELFGRRLYGELLGNVDLGQWIVLGTTGKLLAAEDSPVVTALAITLGIIDPRIWPLKVTRVASAFGRFTSGVACGALLYDSATLGPHTGTRAAHFLCDVARGRDAGASLEAAVDAAMDRQSAPGFGVPFRDADERIVALGGFLRSQGRDARPMWRLLEAITPVVKARKGLPPNIAVGTAAAMMDIGLGPDDVTPTGFALMQLPQLANALEGAEQRPAALQRLAPERVRYVGRPPRRSPKATVVDDGGGDATRP